MAFCVIEGKHHSHRRDREHRYRAERHQRIWRDRGSAFTSDGSECFVRSPQGTITVLGPSHCVTAGINLFGAITGIAGPTSTGGPPPTSLVEGFVRSPKGVFTLFVAPGTSQNGTYSEYIDAYGGLASYLQNYRDVAQNFLEPTPGNFITITPPGAYDTYITGLSELGAATGYYNLSNGGPAHGFVRDVRGTLTTFDFPGVLLLPPGLIFSGSLPNRIARRRPAGPLLKFPDITTWKPKEREAGDQTGGET